MKKIALSILFLVVLGLGIYYDISYQALRVWRVFERVKQLENTHQAYTDKNIDEIKKNYANASANLSMPLNNILQEGQNKGLQIITVSESSPVKKDFLFEQQVQLTITGTYQQFLDFLKILKDKHYFMIIDNWAMTRQLPPATTVLNNENTPDTLVINTQIKFYYLS